MRRLLIVIVLLASAMPSYGSEWVITESRVKTKTKTVVRLVEKPQRIRLRWNINGSWSPSEQQTRSHLEGQHGIVTAGMTHQQMLDLHDALHEGRSVTSRSKTTVRVQQSGGCPGGVCPLPAYGRRTVRSRSFFRGR